MLAAASKSTMMRIMAILGRMSIILSILTGSNLPSWSAEGFFTGEAYALQMSQTRPLFNISIDSVAE